MDLVDHRAAQSRDRSQAENIARIKKVRLAAVAYPASDLPRIEQCPEHPHVRAMAELQFEGTRHPVDTEGVAVIVGVWASEQHDFVPLGCQRLAHLHDMPAVGEAIGQTRTGELLELHHKSTAGPEGYR